MTEPFVAVSSAMRVAVDRLAYAAVSTDTVLVTGEAGTGKDRVVREIHARGKRSAAPLVFVRCASLEEAALDAELFGGDALRRAAGGTLVLDELGALPAGLQVRVVAMLQRVRHGEVGARIVATTSVSRAKADNPSRLGQIAPVKIDLPPLRERRDDILPLAHAFLDGVAARTGSSRLLLAPAAAEALETHDWPANVRQLEQGIQLAAGSACSGVITLDSIPPKLRPGAVGDLAALSYREMLVVTRDRSTREYLQALLNSFAGNVSRAAAHAGIERESFYRLLKRYGLDAHTFRSNERMNVARS